MVSTHNSRRDAILSKRPIGIVVKALPRSFLRKTHAPIAMKDYRYCPITESMAISYGRRLSRFAFVAYFFCLSIPFLQGSYFRGNGTLTIRKQKQNTTLVPWSLMSGVCRQNMPHACSLFRGRILLAHFLSGFSLLWSFCVRERAGVTKGKTTLLRGTIVNRTNVW